MAAHLCRGADALVRLVSATLRGLESPSIRVPTSGSPTSNGGGPPRPAGPDRPRHLCRRPEPHPGPGDRLGSSGDPAGPAPDPGAGAAGPAAGGRPAPSRPELRLHRGLAGSGSGPLAAAVARRAPSPRARPSARRRKRLRGHRRTGGRR
ncbi:MAG: hypothetical protein HZY73_05940 [Micropruina sp.]|nr:MAG: hypothetical protein HZY73_05940 [Micropruina sp.]